MRQPRHVLSLLVAAAGTALLWGASLSGIPASAATAASPPAGPIVLPSHVFSPYADPSNNLTTTAANAGVQYLTLDFLQTPQAGSCTVDWNGDPSTPVGTYSASIAALQAEGGQVVPSFGGSAADSEGTELADSCHSVAGIAAAYENVITTYHVTRLDLDTEEDSLNNYAGISRRNQAIAMVEQWARQTGRTVQFVYTIPTNTTGTDPGGAYVLQNAVANHAQIAVVDIMTFDFYDNQPHEMADNTQSAATAIYNVLHSLYPGKSPARIWAMIGVCEDIGSARHPGQDDYGSAETFTIADANVTEQWAAARGLAELTFWNLSGDNSATAPFQYSHAFEPFTSAAGPAASGSSVASTSASRMPRAAAAALAILTDQPTGNLKTVSCPDTTFCMAVGEYGSTAIRWNGRSWSAPVPIDPGGAKTEVTSLSCSSARFCAAVDTGGRVLEWNGSGWSPPHLIDRAGGLSAVSCPAGQQPFCVAVDGSGDAVTYRDGSWSQPRPADGSGAGLQSVSCASAVFCMAGDWDGNAVEFTGSSWSAPVSLETTTGSSGGGIGSISCPTAAFCIAADWEGSELTWNGTSWSAPVAFDPAGAGGLISLSCRSAALCTAVDGGGDALTWNGTTWTSTEIDVTGDGTGAVSCASADFCMAVDWNGNALEWNGTSWTAPAVSCPDTTSSSAGTCTFTGTFTDARAGVVSGVSCAGQNFCAAVDDNGNALTWNGRRWSAPVLLDPIAGVFRSVSCASARFCAAVDGNGYAFEWDGHGWTGTTQFSVTSPVDPSPGGLESVSCPPAAGGQYCVALDAVGNKVVWNGQSWSPPQPADSGV